MTPLHRGHKRRLKSPARHPGRRASGHQLTCCATCETHNGEVIGPWGLWEVRRDIRWGEPVGSSTSLPHVCVIVSGVLGMLHISVCYSWKDGQVIVWEREKTHVHGYMSVLPTSYLVSSPLLQPEQSWTWAWAAETNDPSFLVVMACS